MPDAPSDADVLARFPRVRLDHVNKEYYRALLERRLIAGRCTRCRTWHTPLRPICAACWSAEIAIEPLSGAGTVYLLTMLHQGPAGVPYDPPWPLAAIELREQRGLRIVGPLVDSPPGALQIGRPVDLVWIERDGAPWPAFRVIGEADVGA